jgi:hypothetical protein
MIDATLMRGPWLETADEGRDAGIDLWDVAMGDEDTPKTGRLRLNSTLMGGFAVTEVNAAELGVGVSSLSDVINVVEGFCANDENPLSVFVADPNSVVDTCCRVVDGRFAPGVETDPILAAPCPVEDICPPLRIGKPKLKSRFTRGGVGLGVRLGVLAVGVEDSNTPENELIVRAVEETPPKIGRPTPMLSKGGIALGEAVGEYETGAPERPALVVGRAGAVEEAAKRGRFRSTFIKGCPGEFAGVGMDDDVSLAPLVVMERAELPPKAEFELAIALVMLTPVLADMTPPRIFGSRLISIIGRPLVVDCGVLVVAESVSIDCSPSNGPRSKTIRGEADAAVSEVV